MLRFLGLAAGLAALAPWPVAAQAFDPGTPINNTLAEATGGRLKLSFEFRNRFESRTGNDFGRQPDLLNPVIRTHVGLEFRAADWLKVSATMHDCRAPLYGAPAPNTVRDTADLHDASLEFMPGRDTGFGAVVGRQVANLGDGRVVGVSLWANASRAYDGARVYYRLPHGRLEFLFLSMVKVRTDEFDRPELGDRLWGMYDTFGAWVPGGSVDVYLLRRDQNRPGGFAGSGRLEVNTAGARVAGPVAAGVRYTVEAAVQTGHAGPLPHRALGWFSSVSRKFGRLETSAEYKYASGSDQPGVRDGTYDQLYTTNHDRFGHADLFGWRNIHNVRSLETLRVTKALSANVMYDNWWLASARDALYNGSARAIVVSRDGSAGRHVGQEADLFATCRYGHWLFGAGAAKVFPGEFLKRTTPGVGTRYLYVFQTLSF